MKGKAFTISGLILATTVSLSACRIADGKLDFYWISEQFTPAVDDTVILEGSPVSMVPATTLATAPAPVAPSQAAPRPVAPHPLPTPLNPPAANQQSGFAWFKQNAPTTGEGSQSARRWAQNQTEPAPATTILTYSVVHGDTLSAIARRYHTNVHVLIRLNRLDINRPLQIGQKLQVPTQGQAAPQPRRRTTTPLTPDTTPAPAPTPTPTPAPTPAPASGTPQTYTILTGDTLSSIARQHNISTSELMQANNIAPENADKISAGDTLTIPAPTRP